MIKPISKISGSEPTLKETEHFYLRLSDFQEPLSKWLSGREGWRNHVLNFSKGWIEEGLHDRAITRDLDWGIEVPVEGIGAGKKIYVRFEAGIGYLSAAKEWSKNNGLEDDWKKWWTNPAGRSVYCIGKDKIPFHSIIWPAILFGYGGLNLPRNGPATQ